MIPSESYTVSAQERNRLSTARALTTKGSQSIAELIAMLVDPSWVVRRVVVEALASLGDPAIAPLCEVLKSQRDNEARLAAAVDALVASKGKPEAALQALTNERDPAIITDAVQVLGRRRSGVAVPKLIELTRHDNDIVAVSAIEALGRVGGRSAVEALIETVQSGNFFKTFPAIDILGRSADRRVVEPLSQLLNNTTYLPEAARALGRSGERAAAAPLIALLKSNVESVVRIAAVSLWDLRFRYEEKSGGDASPIDEILKKEIKSEMIRRIGAISGSLDAFEAIAVCNLFGAIQNPEARPVLTTMLKSSPPVVACAAHALRTIDDDAESQVLQAIKTGDSARRKVLLPLVARASSALEIFDCLTDEDGEVRAVACETFAHLGNPNVVPKIYELLSDSNLRVVHAATAALQALGSQQSRELAVEASKSENPVVRRAALRILAYFGDTLSLQPILDGLSDADARVREVAIQGLPYLENRAAYCALCDAAKSTDIRTRALAMRSMSHLAKADEQIYSILLNGLRDADAWVRYYACQSLGRLSYAPASIEISTLLKDEAGQVRVSAVEALSHMESRHAHRALQRAADSQDVDVRRAALVGLGITHRIEDLQIVLTAAASTDVSTRLIALSAMMSFNSPLVMAALSSAALDNDEQVRSTAIGFLAGRPEAEATEVLVELLNSEITREQAKAALLIPQITRTSGILVALESASDDSAPALISILLRIQRPEAKNAILAALKLENVAARKAAAAGLATNLTSENVTALREAAENDPDSSVREIASLLLRE